MCICISWFQNERLCALSGLNGLAHVIEDLSSLDQECEHGEHQGFVSAGLSCGRHKAKADVFSSVLEMK